MKFVSLLLACASLFAVGLFPKADFEAEYRSLCASFRAGPGYSGAAQTLEGLQAEAEALHEDIEQAIRRGQGSAEVRALATRTEALAELLALLSPGGSDQMCHAQAAPLFADLGLSVEPLSGSCLSTYRVELWSGQLLSYWVHNERANEMASLNWAVNQGPFPARSGQFNVMGKHLREMVTLLPDEQDPSDAFYGKPYRLGEMQCQWKAQGYSFGCE